MRTLRAAVSILLGAALFVGSSAAETDMNDCWACKQVASAIETAKMESEVFELETGFVSVSTLKPRHRKRYDDALAKLTLASESAGSESPVKLCSACRMLATMVKADASFDFESVGNARLLVVTSEGERLLEKMRDATHSSHGGNGDGDFFAGFVALHVAALGGNGSGYEGFTRSEGEPEK